jgi:hypothetical protein
MATVVLSVTVRPGTGRVSNRPGLGQAFGVADDEVLAALSK